MQDVSAFQSALSDGELDLIDRYWRAANYLSVGQIYLLDNALLHKPLRPDHIKPRLLGHWSTTPVAKLRLCHLNRAIRARDLNIIYVCGPGHGGPGMVVNSLAWTRKGVALGCDLTRLSTKGFEGVFELRDAWNLSGNVPSRVEIRSAGVAV